MVAKDEKEALEKEALLEAGFMDINSVSGFFAVSRQKVYELMNEGTLPFTFIGQSRRIPRSAVLELASRGLQQTKHSEQ